MHTREPNLQALAERVTKLEAQNRRLKQGGIAVLVFASTLMFMAEAQPDRVIEANSFQLKDSTGKVRAKLSVEGPNGPTLSFLDAKGVHVASLSGGDEPFLVLFRPGTEEQIKLGTFGAMYGLGLYDKGIRAGLTIQPGSSSSLDFFDESGKPQATMQTDQTGASILFSDSAGKITSSWANLHNGNAFFAMDRAAGKFRLAVGKAVGGPSLELEDKDQKVIWSAP